jgi:connector enhancer of kinase suppressor of Ras 2
MRAFFETAFKLSFQKKQSVSTQTMAAVADVLDSLWLLISWLDRAPFNAHHHYNLFKAELVKISVELATNAHRDKFAERPVNVIRYVAHSESIY